MSMHGAPINLRSSYGALGKCGLCLGAGCLTLAGVGVHMQACTYCGCGIAWLAASTLVYVVSPRMRSDGNLIAWMWSGEVLTLCWGRFPLPLHGMQGVRCGLGPYSDSGSPRPPI